MTFSVNNQTFVDSSRVAYAIEVKPTGANTYLEVRSFPNAMGEISGYASGGFGPGGRTNVIDKFPFASNSNAADVGDLTVNKYSSAGQSSSVSGYTSGGDTGIGGTPTTNVIDKFSFATNANATDVGDLTVARMQVAGQSSSVSGYTSGGYFPPTTNSNTIDKFPFATNSNASDAGDLTVARHRTSGQSSPASGYTAGGFAAPLSYYNVIDKFPFATNSNATDVGDLSTSDDNSAGNSSSESGYTSTRVAPIQKFSFSTDSNSTTVGNLSVAREYASGQSSTVSGYTSGGQIPGNLNVIDKYPFASDANATDVGDLTVDRWFSAGQQD